jgi:hypothetical protein
MFENKMEGRLFGPKKVEETGEWRILHSEEFCYLYSSSGIFLFVIIMALQSYVEAWSFTVS